LGQLEKLRL